MESPNEEPLVLFVCRHGAAKSVLAAATLRSLARERGLAIRAQAAGVEPQEHISTSLIPLLTDEAAALRHERPRSVTAGDLDEAWRTVTFDVEPDELPATSGSIERWDGVAAVSEDPIGAKHQIEKRVTAMLDEFG